MPPPGAVPGHAPPRSLAAALRTWSEEALTDLLQERPDLAVPLPHDLAALAHRATLRPSVHLAVDSLDLPTLQVLEVLVALSESSGPVSLDQVGAAWGGDARPAVDRLRALALAWGTDDQLTPVRRAGECLGPHPAGLGPPSGLDAATIRDLLTHAPDAARAVLDKLAWDGPLGQVTHADRRPDPDSTAPLDWLLARGLLTATGADEVVLPREVALVLRAGRTHRDPALTPPTPAPRPAPQADTHAAGAAAEAVRLVAALAQLWEATPPAVLRSGGLGVRELRRTALALEVDEAVAARVIELAHAAGLIADDGELDPHWAPTPDVDAWLAHDVPQRWVELATAYLASPRCPHLVGTRTDKGVRNALGNDLAWTAAPTVRAWLLHTVAALRTDSTPRGIARDEIVGLFVWTAPRRATPVRRALLEAAVAEAIWLGLLGTEIPDVIAVPSFTLPLIGATEDGERQAADLLGRALPAPVDHILLQADLTAIAPGPLDRHVARELDLIADVESRGGATVLRFTPTSIRRGLDAGRTGDDILAWLEQHSRTPVPQPLAYLIGDSARRHGRVRVGTAASFVRSDDETALSELLADRRADGLQLRRLAPTVLAAQAPPAAVLEVLRSLGLAPAAEAVDGSVVVTAPPVHRTGPRRRPVRAAARPPAPSRAALRSAAAALRLTELAAHDGSRQGTTDVPPSPPGLPPTPADVATVLIQLSQAVARRSPVWVAYVDAQGRVGQRLVEPIEVAAGRLQAFDRSTARILTVPIARVTRVTPLPSGQFSGNSPGVSPENRPLDGPD
ncbi:MAG: helicase-associated domain-containing protein [Kineosporiaceae bacterium]|nr:helicase-associated domain-containing protein [Kineosporiaceae bacterium]